MTKTHDDHEVRELFQELKAETEALGRTPDFRVMMERAKSARPVTRRAQPSRQWVWAGGWASAALAASVVGLLLTGTGTNQDAEFERLVAGFSSDASGGAWRSPTAGLLEVPGLELLRGVPDVGGSVRGGGPGERPEGPAPDERESRL